MKAVTVEVILQEGTCWLGHRVGDRFVCGAKTPDGVCGAAYNAIYPTVRALAAGGSFPWANPDGSADLACPDHRNPVVFRLKAVD